MAVLLGIRASNQITPASGKPLVSHTGGGLVLRAADQDRPLEGVEDLTFGEYVRLLERPDRWARLELAIDRTLFCDNLDRVRAIRNDVMHFDTDGIEHNDLTTLRDFARFLRELKKLTN